MIKVSVRRDADGSVQSFRVKGHAGYDVEGRDIICSSVSHRLLVFLSLHALFHSRHSNDRVRVPGHRTFKNAQEGRIRKAVARLGSVR